MNRIGELPVSRFRNRLEQLSPAAQTRALGWLRRFHFTESDLETLEVDAAGGIYYVDQFSLEQTITNSLTEPAIAQAAVPISPFPASLVFHSKPGSANILFLNFSGDTITGTSWNSSSRSSIPATAFSSDADYTTFSDSEQVAIKRIWERVSEDYAPFDIDVTTERPATFTTRTAHALITRNTDVNGVANPSSTAGGVAYVDVFSHSDYANFRPAWIYFNNLANTESYIAEAVSHEIGHNMGLSHDGTTTSSYYGGHGSGNISWGPIMGTGYDRNVSQWSKGEYYLANNTQDDLSIIAGKLPYRPDDHGNTSATATPLVIVAGTNISSTTPETDPTNTNKVNKGVLQSNTDVDVFSFVTGAGPVKINVNPWLTPGGTRGGNLDVALELRDANGVLLMTNNPATDTIAEIQTNLSDGQYFLYVKNSAAGNPLSSTPTGYTAYGSIGQYFISGNVLPSGYQVPPSAALQISDITQSGTGAQPFTVTYSSGTAIDVGTIDNQDIRITGPHGYNELAEFISLDTPGNGAPRTATYAVTPPNGTEWSWTDNGDYVVSMEPNAVFDVDGAPVNAGQLGQFSVNAQMLVYRASMDTDPGWTLQPLWQYGQPAYVGTGPTAGFTGANIIAYNLSGSYGNNLSTKYATTPVIDCSGASSLVLRFQRWLGLKNGDIVNLEVSTNGANWTSLWSSTHVVNDSTWQLVQYSLPAWTANCPTLQLRWSITSGTAQDDIGWNLDDVEIVGVPQDIPAAVQLTATVNDATWGSVTPSNAIYAAGSSIQLQASAAPYFQFVEWTGDVTGSVNPLSLIVSSNISVQAVFSEVTTTNFPTPLWWLAANGITNDSENLVNSLGANATPFWQSYIAGLDPSDPNSQLRLAVAPDISGTNCVLQWNTVTNRLYTIWRGTNLFAEFSPVPGAINLPDTVHQFTNTVNPESAAEYYRIQVQKP